MDPVDPTDATVRVVDKGSGDLQPSAAYENIAGDPNRQQAAAQQSKDEWVT
jgi:hypothetical protein